MGVKLGYTTMDLVTSVLTLIVGGIHYQKSKRSAFMEGAFLKKIVVNKSKKKKKKQNMGLSRIKLGLDKNI